MKLEIAVPTSEELTNQAQSFLSVAEAYTIDSAEMVHIAAADLVQIKAKAKALEDQRKAITKPMDEAKAKIMDLFRQPVELLNKAERLIKAEMIRFDQEQEKIRREREEKLREQARIEREKIEAEARKAAERAAKEAEKGNTQKAEALQEHAMQKQMEAETVQAPIVVREQVKVKGVSMKMRWKAEIIDASLIPREYLVPNEKALNDVAQATKGALSIPGVRFYGVPEVSSRSAIK